jgi:hypothetical protein
MSSFRVAPRQGHLDRLQRMYGYLKRHPDGAIRLRTGIPDHESRTTTVIYNWINSVYGPNDEELQDNIPTPRGKPFRTTTYEDANLIHCLVTGRSMSGINHLVNQTPLQWFCKKQNVLETATNGSEFMVARQATEHIMDLCYKWEFHLMVLLECLAITRALSHHQIFHIPTSTSDITPYPTIVSEKQSRLRYSSSSTSTVN